MGHKRKRQSEITPVEGPPSKKQATETQTHESAAERRQKRSERKAKKANESKQNASTKNIKDKSKYEPKNKEKHAAKKARSQAQNSTSQELVQPTLTTSEAEDNLASGQDFVSLTDPAALKPTNHSVLRVAAETSSESKGASPRTVRKQAKSEKTKGTVGEQKTSNATGGTEKGPSSNNPRFIAFVGNLPYSTTTPQITSHFRKLTPTSIRHPTDKNTGKSKGYAFLEFDNYSAMKTCLKVYHHSMFDPERTSKLPDDAFDENGLEIEKPGQDAKKGSGTGRRINVELTAGGGGKGEGRKEKIRVKNTRLEEQRDRRREAEMKTEKAKRRKSGISDVNQVEIKEKTHDGRGDIHPSRLKRVKA